MIELDRPSWHTRAACRRAPAELDFFVHGRKEQEALVEEWCSACPVRWECRADAIARGPYIDGVWGDTTKQLKALYDRAVSGRRARRSA